MVVVIYIDVTARLVTSIKSLPTRWISTSVKTTSHNYKYSPPHQSSSKHTFHDWYFSYLNIIETWWQYNWIGYETYERQVLFNFFLITSWCLHWLLIRYELWIIIVVTIIITLLLLLLSRAVKVNPQIYKRRWHVMIANKRMCGGRHSGHFGVSDDVCQICLMNIQ